MAGSGGYSRSGNGLATDPSIIARVVCWVLHTLRITMGKYRQSPVLAFTHFWSIIHKRPPNAKPDIKTQHSTCALHSGITNAQGQREGQNFPQGDLNKLVTGQIQSFPVAKILNLRRLKNRLLGNSPQETLRLLRWIFALQGGK